VLHSDWLLILIFVVLLFSLTPVLGIYLFSVFKGLPNLLTPIVGRLERRIYRFCDIAITDEMSLSRYAWALLFFNLSGVVVLFLIQFFQHVLPLNPQGFHGVDSILALNTAVSFATNTDLQAYAGETTLSYFTQMAGLTVQNFLSAATGMCALLVLIRGLASKVKAFFGNFWVDLVRCVLYVLLPLSIVVAVILISQGVVQTVHCYKEITTLENTSQVIPLGPVASQVAIKLVGTNGGGFFNTNSCHPFENPTTFTNLFSTLLLVLLPAAITYMYGLWLNSTKQGWVIFLVMFAIWFTGFVISLHSEYTYNPVVEQAGSLEGKEMRIGVTGSILFSTTTTATANGSTNSMLSSLTPLAGGIALFNIMLGETIFGGLGVGLCSMIMFILLAIFISGLMVGRSPEYLGKKIEKKDVQLLMLAIAIPNFLSLAGASLASQLECGLSSIANKGPHGLTEILYIFASAAGNNGSSFAGLNANTNFYNISLAIVMFFARLSILLPSLAIGATFNGKKISPASSGTFTTDNYLFAVILIGVIIIVGALTYFPALALGPIVEHLLMLKGRFF
jgi:potassium-transporting ATPase potassium-binding subunit